MTRKGWTSKKVCDIFGCRWIYVKAKRQIPYEQSLKRMKLRKGGTIKEEYLDEIAKLLKKAEKGTITEKDLEILNKAFRRKKKVKKI